MLYTRKVLSMIWGTNYLAAFVKWGLENFPAKRTILVVNGHGCGIVNFRAVGPFLNSIQLPCLIQYDDASGSYFSEKKVRKQLKQVLGRQNSISLSTMQCYIEGIEVIMSFIKSLDTQLLKDHIFWQKVICFKGENQIKGQVYQFISFPGLLTIT